MDELEKKYYRISEVSELLGIPASTLRFWERQLTIISPKRTRGGTRFYTPEDIRKLQRIYYLVKEKGMKLDKAQEAIRQNHSGIVKRTDAIDRLKEIRQSLLHLLSAFESERPSNQR